MAPSYNLGIGAAVARSRFADANEKVHVVNVFNKVAIEAGASYVMNRGYIDFGRRYLVVGILCGAHQGQRAPQTALRTPGR